MCGLFGVYFYGKQKDLNVLNLGGLVEELGNASSVRGTDATGIAYILDGKKVEIDKRGVPAYQFNFDIPSNVGVVLGHTRASTHGSATKNYNNHPFRGKATNVDFAFAHNGVLDNYLDLQISQKLPKTKVEVDSYVVVQLIEKLGELNIPNIKKVAEMVVGSFTFTMLDQNEDLYIVKNDSPLVIAHFPALKLYAYASTESILVDALMNFHETKEVIINSIKTKIVTDIELIYPKQGEILVINKKAGLVTKDTFTPQERFYSQMWWDFGYKSAIRKSYDCSCDYTTLSKKGTKKGTKKDTATYKTNDKTNYDFNNESYYFILEVAEDYGYNITDVQFLLDVGYAEEEIYDLILTDTLEEALIEELGFYSDKE